MNNFDKIFHFIICFVIVLVADIFMPLWASVLLACAAAVGKEIYDRFHPDKHTADWADLAADFFGILVALAIILTA